MQNNPYVSSPGTVAAAALKDPIKKCIFMHKHDQAAFCSFLEIQDC